MTFIIRTIFVKPENAINIPEKYRKAPSQTKPTETEKREETTEVVREEEKYDIDPRQAALEGADLSKVNVFNQTSVRSVLMTNAAVLLFLW